MDDDLTPFELYSVYAGGKRGVIYGEEGNRHYLANKPKSFYKVRAAARGSKIVTSRGWEDLSRMLQAYEAEGMVPPASLPGRYLQDPEVSEDFGVYYELFRKYEDDYKVTEILAGHVDDAIARRAAAAPFDERVALVGLLLDSMLGRAHGAIELEEALKLARKDLLEMKGPLGRSESPVEVVERRIRTVEAEGTVGKKVRGQVGDRAVIRAERLRVLRAVRAAVVRGVAEGKGAFDAAKAAFNAECKAQAKMVKEAVASLDAGFLFLDRAFGKGSQEALIYVTKLSADPVLIRLVSEHGSKEFMKHNKSLLFTERGLGLLEEIKGLEE